MAIKPIIFSTDMVRAILDGRKTMTRRVIKIKYSNTDLVMRSDKYGTRLVERQSDAEPNHLMAVMDVPSPYRAGDILWVREAWNGLPENKRAGIPAQYWYKADDISMNPDDRWRSSRYMPKAAARIFLRVTDVRAERLHDIQEADAVREGMVYTDYGTYVPSYKMSQDGGKTFHQCKPQHHYGWHDGTAKKPESCYPNARAVFAGLWDKINEKRGYGWEANPWVWVITFERCEKPEGWCT